MPTPVVTVRTAAEELSPYAAVILRIWLAETVPAETENLVEVALAETVTDGGTVTALAPEVKVTTKPPGVQHRRRRKRTV